MLEAISDCQLLPEKMTESSEFHGSLCDALVSLSAQARAVVQLRCFGQLTFMEIGRALNLPETTVKTSFYRWLPRMRRALACNLPCA